MVNGVLGINKPSGMTSHDVVNRVRKLFDIRRVGHTGTLDPLATGVLVLLLGSATRLSQFMIHDKKHYRGTIRLGIETSSYDADGEVVSVNPVNTGYEEIVSVVSEFQGELAQIPPMYSAIKVNGQKLYNLARQGKIIERQPRPVTIHHIQVQSWHPPDLVLDVVCSAGTYIRSLAHDIGQTLGCGAYLRALSRSSSHGFILDECHSLERLGELKKAGDLMQALLPPRTAICKMPVVYLTPEQVKAVRFGQKIIPAGQHEGVVLQALDNSDGLVAVLIPVDDNYWRPKVVMPFQNQG
jgi:tRNA pseudouridine55 synthase